MRKLLCVVFLVAKSFPVFAATPTEVVSAYHAAVASGNTMKALSLLSPAVQIFEGGHVEESKDEYAGLRCTVNSGHACLKPPAAVC